MGKSNQGVSGKSAVWAARRVGFHKLLVNSRSPIDDAITGLFYKVNYDSLLDSNSSFSMMKTMAFESASLL